MRIYIAHSSQFPYQQALYAPIQTHLAKEHIFTLPHAEGTDTGNSKEIIEKCDLVIAEVSYPSTGMGIELGWAHAAGIPIVCIHRSDATPSSGLKHIASSNTPYKDAAELVERIRNAAANAQ